MKTKLSQISNNEDRYGYSTPFDSSKTKRRIDLNDLLQRVKEEKNKDKKTNLIIISVSVIATVVIFLTLSL